MSGDVDVPKRVTTAIQIPDAEFVRTIAEFCRFARARGLSTSTKKLIGCLQALGTVRSGGVTTFKFVLKTVLCSSREDWVLFDALFAEFWQNAEPKRDLHPKNSGSYEFSASREEAAIQALFGDSSRSNLPTKENQDKAVSGASTAERLRKIDFARVPQSDLPEFERLSRRLMRQLSFRISRRLQPGKDRGVVDLRRTIRLSLGSGGDPIKLSYKKQKRQRAKLVVLLDVSDSMNPYSAFLLKFAYVLKRYFREVVSFIFSTSLIEINEVLKAQRWSDALRVLSQMTTGWSGGTRIGGSLKEFNRHYSGKLLSPETVLLILSDGWDTEGPEALVAELRKIKRRIGKLIWLNPLLGQEGYEPVTRAMNAALPYIDVFAPAHNLESLLELERHLIKA